MRGLPIHANRYLRPRLDVLSVSAFGNESEFSEVPTAASAYVFGIRAVEPQLWTRAPELVARLPSFISSDVTTITDNFAGQRQDTARPFLADAEEIMLLKILSAGAILLFAL